MSRRWVDLSEAERAQKEAERDAFLEFFRWIAQIATPIILLLILWRVW